MIYLSGSWGLEFGLAKIRACFLESRDYKMLIFMYWGILGLIWTSRGTALLNPRDPFHSRHHL